MSLSETGNVTMNFREWIPITVRTLRKSNDMTLQSLSEKTGLSLSYLSDIERGRTLPAIDTLDTIFTALGTNLILSAKEDYIPTGYVWVSRETLKRLSEIVGEITPKE